MKKKDCISDLKSTELWKYLNSVDKKYAQSALHFLEKINPILDSIKEYFPFYTRHDASHGLNVIKRISQIINPECLRKGTNLSFSPPEAFLLICAGYAHDLGMAILPGEKSGILKELNILTTTDWKTNKELQKHLRKTHSERGGKFINDRADELHFPKNLVGTVNDLMRSHNLSINRLETELNKPYAAGQKNINLKQLGCILCIADAIEFSDNRVIEGVLDKLKLEKGLNEIISYRENMKHVCIGDSVAIGDNNRIIFNGTFDEAPTLNLAYHTIDLIEEWVRGYVEIDRNSSKPRLSIRGDAIEKNIGMFGKDFQRISINLKKENIINLIASNSIWTSNKSLPLKELLQNSVEACRYRLNNSTKSQNYNPQIRIIFDRDKKTIQITDNGCGMSKHVILNNFLTVGNSRSFDASYASEEFSSLARFGVGFWSVFTIADKAKIETAPFELIKNNLKAQTYEGLEFEVGINPLFDYTIFNKLNRSVGTSIFLHLKKNINTDEIFQGLMKEIVCSEIPITIDGVDETISISTEIKTPTLKQLFGAKYNYVAINNVKLFEYRFDLAEFNFRMYFPYLDDPEISFKLNHQRISDLFAPERRMQSELSICGFRHNLHLSSLFFGTFLIGGYTLHTNNPKGFVYSLDRRIIIESQRLDDIKKLIENLTWEGYINFLKKTKCLNAEKIYEFNTASRRNGGSISYSIYTGNIFENIKKERYPFIYYKLYKIEPGCDIENAAILYKTLDEILEMDITILSCSKHIVHSNIFKIPTEDLKTHYRLLANLTDDRERISFLHEASLETSILFDNQVDSCVKLVDVKFSSLNKITIPYLQINPSKVKFSGVSKGYIGDVRGVWSGSIYVKNIIGNKQYVFLNQNSLIISKGSKMATDFHSLYEDGKLYKLCELIRKLSEVDQGFIDDEIKKYL